MGLQLAAQKEVDVIVIAEESAWHVQLSVEHSIPSDIHKERQGDHL